MRVFLPLLVLCSLTSVNSQRIQRRRVIANDLQSLIQRRPTAQLLHVAPLTQRIGGSSLAEPEYAPQPYHYIYSSALEDGHHTHEETSDSGNRKTGSYTISLADGRQRIVNYVADEHGFRAAVQSNELGTESKSPADVNLVSSAPTGAEAAYMAEPYVSRGITGFPYYRKAAAA